MTQPWESVYSTQLSVAMEIDLRYTGAMSRLIATTMLWVCLVHGAAWAANCPPGEWRIDITGESYSVVANQAPLSALLDDLAAKSPVGVRFADIDDRLVTGDFRALALRELLERLKVNYTLHYQPSDTDARHPRLLGAWVGGAPVERLSDDEARAIAQWIADLQHDDVSYNAIKASDRLRALGVKAVPALERALVQGDYQTRQFAADILAYLGDDFYTPSDRFLQVLVEGLRDDIFPDGTHPDGRQACVFVFNAHTAFDYLAPRSVAVDRVEPLLAQALYNGDPQQEYLAAVLLASHAKTAYLPRLAELLIPHLADNRLASDGILSTHALHKLGPAIRPYLLAPLPQADPQQVDLTELILYFLDHPDAQSVPTGLKTYSHVVNPIRYRPLLQFWTRSE